MTASDTVSIGALGVLGRLSLMDCSSSVDANGGAKGTLLSYRKMLVSGRVVVVYSCDPNACRCIGEVLPASANDSAVLLEDDSMLGIGIAVSGVVNESEGVCECCATDSTAIMVVVPVP